MTAWERRTDLLTGAVLRYNRRSLRLYPAPGHWTGRPRFPRFQIMPESHPGAPPLGRLDLAGVHPSHSSPRRPHRASPPHRKPAVCVACRSPSGLHEI